MNAQSNQKNEPIFGTVVVRKTTSDSTKKPFNVLKPAFLRLGIIGGSIFSSSDGNKNSTGGMLGLRVEYGISNRFSVVGQFQNNGIRNNTFPSVQTSIGINWMPFKSQRLQPYVGLGLGIGGNGFGRKDERFGRGGFGGMFNFDQDSTGSIRNRRHASGFGVIKTGLNYVIARRIIGTIEANYQVPFQSENSKAGANIALGLSYQFGRNKK